MLKGVLVVVAALAVLVAAAWLKLRGPDIPYAALEAKYAGPGSAFVDLPDGVRLHYRADGDPALPVVVLVHGYGDSFTSWEGWTKVLASGYRVLSLDLPGHGLTRAPERYRLSADAYTKVVEEFATALALPRFAIAGNSMGGGVAWHYALAHPERLSALILVDAAGWPMATPAKLPLAFRILRYRAGRWLLAHIDNRPLIEEGLRKDVYDPAVITPAFIDRWAEFQRAPGHRAILMSAELGSLASASDATLAAIRVPTLVLHGEADPLIPVASGRRFAAAIPGAKLIIYPRVGHLPQVEIPAQSAGDVAAFLTGAGATP
jgi:pimeloyl-ACP methyl ester carboxylesterase